MAEEKKQTEQETVPEKETPETELPAGKYILITEEDFDRKLKAAGRAGAKEGVAAYRREQEESQEEMAEKVKNSAKTIIIHYRQLKKMRKTSVCDADTVTDPTLKEILEGIAGRVRRDEFNLTSTSRNKIVTGMLMNHVDVQLENYKRECRKSKVPDIGRRYTVVEMMFLREEPLKAEEVAEEMSIDKSSVYRTLEKAYDDLAVLFFGIEGIMGIEIRRKKRSRAKKEKQ